MKEISIAMQEKVYRDALEYVKMYKTGNKEQLLYTLENMYSLSKDRALLIYKQAIKED